MSTTPKPAAAAEERSPFDDATCVYLRALGKRYPTIDAALAEIAHLKAILSLPKGTIHVVSDVHGEFKKLKHIINNASGTLRPLVEEVFGDRLDAGEQQHLLNAIYYPRETYLHIASALAGVDERRTFLKQTLRRQLELARELACRVSLKDVDRVLPEAYRLLFRELLHERDFARSEAYVDGLLDSFAHHDRDLDLLRMGAHVVRNLLVYELIVAGDLGDRGPRIDRVIDYIMRQPRVAISWGNHDVTWMGACLGHEACMATVLRISLRYRRLSQLEEGYGIPMAPLEKLARDVYADDPAERFTCRGEGMRDGLLMSRMQKAIAIIQFKLEGQAARRNPGYGMEHRMLLDKIDPVAGTVAIDGKVYPLRDTNLPTVDWSDPYRLSSDEEAAVARLRQSFLLSPVLWEQMRFVERKGAMFLRRDHNLIFHGCVPVDDTGEFLPMAIGGTEYRGRALFEALDREVHRAFRDRDQASLDMLWYLWTGPRSPLFGKDRMATFETYFVEDKATHKETKNPYFKLIHTEEFCKRVFADFGADPAVGLIVNGHVPVKLEQGESPVKASGNAVTIDGAFSEAYGDKGFTLVLKAGRIYLAQHHHFESVAEAITAGADIVPTISEIRAYANRRLVGDTETGELLRREIGVLELLIRAYRENVVEEHL